MSIDLSSSELHEPTWREIERLVEEVEQFAKTCDSSQPFYEALIERAALALGAASGRVWTAARGGYELTAQFDSNALPAATADGLRHLLADGPRAPGRNGPTITRLDTKTSPEDFQLASAPICLNDQIVAVVELVISATWDPTWVDNVRQILTAFAASAEEFHRHDALRALKGEATFSDRFRHFAERIHRWLEVRDVAFEIANESRLLLGVDRVSVLRHQHGQCRTLAISNLAVVDRRNRTIARLEDMAAAASRIAAPLWHGIGSGAVPELDEPLQAYLDTSHARVVGVVPLIAGSDTRESTEPRVCGAIVVENYSADVPDDLRRRTETLAVHAALALGNAVHHSSLPLRSVVRVAERCRAIVDRKRLPRTLSVVGGIAACIAALVLVPANLTIEAEGQLEPAITRNLYAPMDGEITEIRVQHDVAVTEGETLLVIRSAELDLQHRRIAGERAATEERLLAAESDRIVSRTSDAGSPGLSSATEEELRRRLASLDEQLSIINAQREGLHLRSPIPGRVLTWEADEMLAARPVRRGQLLLSVADVEGRWQLKLQVADHESGYLFNAERDSDRPLDVEFALATAPGVSYRGTIARTARITSLDQQGRSVVEMTVQFDDEEIGDLRPGADAIAKIHCGRRSIGFVWLRDLIEFVQAKVLF